MIVSPGALTQLVGQDSNHVGRHLVSQQLAHLGANLLVCSFFYARHHVEGNFFWGVARRSFGLVRLDLQRLVLRRRPLFFHFCFRDYLLTHCRKFRPQHATDELHPLIVIEGVAKIASNLRCHFS
jgi:hypothetical protein